MASVVVPVDTMIVSRSCTLSAALFQSSFDISLDQERAKKKASTVIFTHGTTAHVLIHHGFKIIRSRRIVAALTSQCLLSSSILADGGKK
jgi:hypothetical protein